MLTIRPTLSSYVPSYFTRLRGALRVALEEDEGEEDEAMRSLALLSACCGVMN